MKLIICSTADGCDINHYKNTLKHYNLKGPFKSSYYDFNYYTIDITFVKDLYKLTHELNQELIITEHRVEPNKLIDALEIYDGYRE